MTPLETLLPQQVRAAWEDVNQGRSTVEAAMAEQTRLIAERKRCWSEALMERGRKSLEESLLHELAAYIEVTDIDEVRARGRRAVDELKAEWTATVDADDPQSIAQYYRRTDGTLYELTWWHTLVEDESPLAYVNALELARVRPGRRYLDFGAGVGSGGLLFARGGFDVTLADISLPLRDFCQWRFARRRLRARFIDAMVKPIPEDAFDVITAMDVFEHLADPLATATALARALHPGGILVARLAAGEDPDRPQHITWTFDATIERLRELGCERIWEDDWLWGHQAFEKR